MLGCTTPGLEPALTPAQPPAPQWTLASGTPSHTQGLIYGAFEQCLYHRTPRLGFLFKRVYYLCVEIAAQPQAHLGLISATAMLVALV